MTSRIRLVVEDLLNPLVFRRRLPSEDGGVPMYVSPSAGLKFLFRPMSMIEPALRANVRRLVRPGSVVWDIGANIGLFTFAAAARAGSGGQVVAFEPDVQLARILQRSRALQPPSSAPVSVIAAAVAREVGLRRFHIARRSRASNAIAGYGHSQMGGVAEERLVPTFTLDRLLDHLPAPAVVKCDVEGAEIEVFAGQTALLTRVRPVVHCEVGEDAADALTGIFRGAGYRLFDGDAAPGAPLVETPRAVWSTVAIPEEAVDAVLRR